MIFHVYYFRNVRKTPSHKWFFCVLFAHKTQYYTMFKYYMETKKNIILTAFVSETFRTVQAKWWTCIIVERGNKILIITMDHLTTLHHAFVIYLHHSPLLLYYLTENKKNYAWVFRFKFILCILFARERVV